MAVTNYQASLTLNKWPVIGLVPESASSAPASPVNGQIWLDTTGPNVKWSLGGVWKNPLARGDHTGTQTASTISDLATVVQAYRLDQFAAPTAPLGLGGQRITSVADPTSPTDGATKQYVDNARAGLSVKDPVRVVAATSINLASLPTAIDGVTLTAGNRFLAAAQTTGAQNGIYTYSTSTGAATRATDADLAGEVFDGSLVAVAEGTAAGSQYIQTATPSGAPGAWTQTWVAYSTGGTSYSAGNGLSLTSNTFTAVADPAGPLAVSSSGISLTAPLPVIFGGTGGITAPLARAALGTVGKFAANVGAITGGVALNITHGLGTLDTLEPTLKDTATGEFIGAKFITVDANTVSCTVGASAASGAYRVTVVG